MMRAIWLAALSLGVASTALAANGAAGVGKIPAGSFPPGSFIVAQAATGGAETPPAVPVAPDAQAPDADNGADNPDAASPDEPAAGPDTGEDDDGGVATDENAFPDNFQFARIPIVFAANPDAPGLTEFQQTLRALADKRDEAGFMQNIAPKIFWDRDFGETADAAQSGEWNFRQAMQIGVPDLDPSYADEGWKRLSALLASNHFAANTEHAGSYCLPAFPTLTEEEPAKKTFALAGMSDEWQLAWGFVDGKIDVMDKFSPDGKVIGSIDTEAVPVHSWAADDDMVWAEIGLPDGKTGFVKADQLGSWVNEQLCLGKDEAGAWKVTGYVGGGD